MQTKVLIFDCFGVLYPDISRNFFKKHKELFKGETSLMDKLSLKVDLGKITQEKFVTELEKATGIPSDKIYFEIYGKLVLNEEMVGLIKKLKKSYKIGLLSNAGQEEIAVIYKDKIDNLFDIKIISYEVGIVKPNPDIYLTCINSFGVMPEECIFIDDSPANIVSAKKVGIPSILYKNIKQLKTKLSELNVNVNKNEA